MDKMVATTVRLPEDYKQRYYAIRAKGLKISWQEVIIRAMDVELRKLESLWPERIE